MSDKEYLEKAIRLSRQSVEQGGFPAGALIVIDDKIVSEGISNGKQLQDATDHAEINAIRGASKKLGKRDLNKATVYSSMEPCLMCFAACYWAKVEKIVFAIPKKKLSKEHYEGLHDLKQINNLNNREIEILHIEDLEEEAMRVVREWEQSN